MKKLALALLLVVFLCGCSPWYQKYGIESQHDLATMEANDSLKPILADRYNIDFARALNTALRNPYSLADLEIVAYFNEHLPLIEGTRLDDNLRNRMIRFLRESSVPESAYVLEDQLLRETHPNNIRLIFYGLLEKFHYSDPIIDVALTHLNHQNYALRALSAAYIVGNPENPEEAVRIATMGLRGGLTDINANIRKHTALALASAYFVPFELFDLLERMSYSDAHPNVQKVASDAIQKVKGYNLGDSTNIAATTDKPATGAAKVGASSLVASKADRKTRLTGRTYCCPYTTDGVLAEWVDVAIKNDAWGKVGSGVGMAAGAAVGSYAAKKALEQVPFGGLIGGIFGSAVGKAAGKKVAQKSFMEIVGGMQKIQSTSDLKFGSLQELSEHLYANNANHPNFPEALKATASVYPAFKSYMR